MTELYEKQKLGAAKLAGAMRQHGAALNASATGTGKTLVALAVAKNLNLLPLILSPIAAAPTWRRWSADLGVPVLDVLNLEKLRTGRTPYAAIQGKGKKARFAWRLDPLEHCVVVDEIHRGLLGRDSLSGRMCAMLRPQGIATLLMSATPFASPLDMKHTGYMLRLHDWSLAGFYSWCRKHGCRDSFLHRGLEFPVRSPEAERWLSEINAQIRDRVVRLTIGDLAEHFGENVVEPVLVSLSDADTKETDRILREMADKLKSPSGNPLVDRSYARQRCELLKVPVLRDMVQDSVAEGLSVYVALSFKASVRELAAMLEEPCALVHGDMSPAERDRSVERFQADEIKVLVATSAAGGASISLHREHPWQRDRTAIVSAGDSAAEFIQALGRVYRAGSAQKAVLQRTVLVSGTVEEKVFRALEAKARNIDTLTDGDLSIG
jgi:hypothetical protein